MATFSGAIAAGFTNGMKVTEGDARFGTSNDDVNLGIQEGNYVCRFLGIADDSGVTYTGNFHGFKGHAGADTDAQTAYAMAFHPIKKKSDSVEETDEGWFVAAVGSRAFCRGTRQLATVEQRKDALDNNTEFKVSLEIVERKDRNNNPYNAKVWSTL